jgi:hypothetical protein
MNEKVGNHHHAQNMIQLELDPGERLLWAGRPKQGTVFRGSDVFMIPFSLLWGGFAIVWEIMALSIPHKEVGPQSVIFPLFGIPFVLIGLYMIFGRFIYDSRKRAHTYYGLSNQRAIIISGLFGRAVKSLNLRSLSDVSLSEKSDRSGTITFGQENQMGAFFGGGGFPGMHGSTAPKFEFIENAKDVYKQLIAQQKN